MSIPVLRNRARLFVDLKEIDKQSNVVREFHQAQRHGVHPVLAQTEPWEKNVGMCGSVVYDEQERRFKAWYTAGGYAEGVYHVQCLAHSDDGINWTKPSLGLQEALGSKQNNIVIPATCRGGRNHFETMLKDPGGSDPERRYKAIGWSSYDWDGPLSGIYTATSPDGMNWNHPPEPVFHHHPRPSTQDLGPIGDAQAMMVDTLQARYVAYLRGQGGARVHSFSSDFQTWTPPVPFLWPMHEEEALYNNTGFAYGEQYLGILTHFDKHPRANTQTLQLITSRDGEGWQRVSAGSLVPLGDIGSWDTGQIMLTGAAPIPVGDRLYIYYRGTTRRHNKVVREFDATVALDQDRGTRMGIGLATLRLDGFASVSATHIGGTFTTVPYQVQGAGLEVNVAHTAD